MNPLLIRPQYAAAGCSVTIAPQAAPTVKAYVKTIGQPAQNITGQGLIWMVLHSKQQTIGEGTLGRLSEDSRQLEPPKAKSVSIPR